MDNPDVDAAMRLLNAIRDGGFAVDTLVVGSVHLTGVRDYRPPIDVERRALMQAERDGHDGSRSIYDDVGADLAGYVPGSRPE